MTKDKKIKILADTLISTLGGMSGEKADKIVKAVAESLYNDVLLLKGKIVEKTEGFIDFTDYLEDYSLRGERFVSHKFIKDDKI